MKETMMTKVKFKNEKIINCEEWDSIIKDVYGRPYCFQQQNGCQERGIEYFCVPTKMEDFENHTVPEIINGKVMGVNFEAWKKRDPKQPIGDNKDDLYIELFWHRNFYPSLEILANDLYNRGIIDAGRYGIEIDW